MPPKDKAEEGQVQIEEERAPGWNAEAEHTLAVDRMAALGDEFEPVIEELGADVRDFLLNIIKSRPKPWSGTTQQEQRDVVAACEHAAGEMIRKTLEALASQGGNAVRVLLTKVALGGDIIITGKVKCFEDGEEEGAVNILSHSIGKFVMLRAASLDDYRGTREAETLADQPDLGFDAEAGDDEQEDEDEDQQD